MPDTFITANGVSSQIEYLTKTPNGDWFGTVEDAFDIVTEYLER
jgi:hypothetical protein